MHPNPIFHSKEHTKDLNFARERAFGTLSLNGDLVPMQAHVPFLLSEDGSSADLHLVRSNAIARRVSTPSPAVIAVTGTDSYISPDWYELKDQVPTWNYVAVHLIGTLERLPDTDLLDVLNRQSAAYEARLLPKPMWHTDKMDEAALAKMLRMIVPYRLTISDVSATWKLGQNKPEPARLAAAEAVEKADFGVETSDLAKAMRFPPKL